MKKPYTSPDIEIVFFQSPDTIKSSEKEHFFKKIIKKLKSSLPSIKNF